MINVYPQFLIQQATSDDDDDETIAARRRRMCDLAVGFGIRSYDRPHVVIETGRDQFRKLRVEDSVTTLVNGTADEIRFKEFEKEYRSKTRSTWANIKKRDRLRYVDKYILDNYKNLAVVDMKRKAASIAMAILLKSTKEIIYSNFKIVSVIVSTDDGVDDSERFV